MRAEMPSFTRSSTAQPCHGRSFKRRTYALWRFLDNLPQAGHAPAAEHAHQLRKRPSTLLDSIEDKIWSWQDCLRMARGRRHCKTSLKHSDPKIVFRTF